MLRAVAGDPKFYKMGVSPTLKVYNLGSPPPVGALSLLL